MQVANILNQKNKYSMTKTNNTKYNRLSDALRQNLLKRKEQQRSRLKDKEVGDLNTHSTKSENQNEELSLKEQGEKE